MTLIASYALASLLVVPDGKYYRSDRLEIVNGKLQKLIFVMNGHCVHIYLLFQETISQDVGRRKEVKGLLSCT